MRERAGMSVLSHLVAFVVGATAIWRLPESSSIQPGHFGAVLLFAYVLLATPPGTAALVGAKTLFVSVSVLYFAARDLIEVALVGTAGVYVVVAYLCYAVIILLASQPSSHEFLRATFRYAFLTFAVSVLVSIYGVYARPLSIERGAGLSGTANHLALQGLILLVVSKEIVEAKALRAVIYVACAAAQIMSLSRAAIAAGAVFLLCRVQGLLLAAILATLGLVIIADTGEWQVPVDVVQRLTLFDNPSDRDGRGYYRIGLYPEYFAFGASDLRMEFAGDPFKGLIHNNLLQPIFAFGVFGAMFVLVVHYAIFQRFGAVSILTLCIVSMGHYFYQNLLFILLVAFALSTPLRVADARQRNASRRPSDNDDYEGGGLESRGEKCAAN